MASIGAGGEAFARGLANMFDPVKFTAAMKNMQDLHERRRQQERADEFWKEHSKSMQSDGRYKKFMDRYIKAHPQFVEGSLTEMAQGRNAYQQWSEFDMAYQDAVANGMIDANMQTAVQKLGMLDPKAGIGQVGLLVKGRMKTIEDAKAAKLKQEQALASLENKVTNEMKGIEARVSEMTDLQGKSARDIVVELEEERGERYSDEVFGRLIREVEPMLARQQAARRTKGDQIAQVIDETPRVVLPGQDQQLFVPTGKGTQRKVNLPGVSDFELNREGFFAGLRNMTVGLPSFSTNPAVERNADGTMVVDVLGLGFGNTQKGGERFLVDGKEVDETAMKRRIANRLNVDHPDGTIAVVGSMGDAEVVRERVSLDMKKRIHTLKMQLKRGGIPESAKGDVQDVIDSYEEALGKITTKVMKRVGGIKAVGMPNEPIEHIEPKPIPKERQPKSVAAEDLFLFYKAQADEAALFDILFNK